MFNGMSLEEFNTYFTGDERCRKYLYHLKWRKGFICFRCGTKESIKGHTAYHIKCKSCKYEESVTANTVFHKLKIPLIKAFAMAFKIVQSNRSASYPDLSRDFKVNLKTAWSFSHKLRQAMVYVHDGSGSSELKVIDSIIVSHRPGVLSGLQKIHVLMTKKKIKSHGKKIITARILCADEQEKNPCELQKGKFILKQKDIILWNLKTWLTGSHHRVSLKYLQAYTNEFFYRLNNRHQKRSLMHTLLKDVVSAKRLPAGPCASK